MSISCVGRHKSSGCPKKLWMPNPGRHSRLYYMGPWETSPGRWQPTMWSLSSPPTPAILQYYDSMSTMQVMSISAFSSRKEAHFQKPLCYMELVGGLLHLHQVSALLLEGCREKVTKKKKKKKKKQVLARACTTRLCAWPTAEICPYYMWTQWVVQNPLSWSDLGL